MPKPFLRISAALVSLSMLADPGTIYAFSLTPPSLATTPLSAACFKDQAMSPRETEMLQELLNGPQQEETDQEAAALEPSRRNFLKIAAGATGLVAAGSSLANAQTAPLPFNPGPLPFPDQIIPVDQLPANVRDLIEFADTRMRAFQNQMFAVDPQNHILKIKAPNQAAYQREAAIVQAKIGQYVVPRAISDMVLKGWMTSAEADQLRARMNDVRQAPQMGQYLFQVLLPRYFAHYGLYWHSQSIFNGNIGIPYIDLRPIEARHIEHIPLSVFPESPVQFDWFELGISLVRTPHNYIPQLPEPTMFFTPLGASQVFVNRDELESAVQNDLKRYREMLRNNPALHSGGLIRPQQEPDLFKRTEQQMLAKALWDATNGKAPMMTDVELAPVIRNLITTVNLRHEAVHVHDDPNPMFRTDNASLRFWEELRGGIGGAVGMTGIAYTIYLIVGLSRPKADSQLRNPLHGPDLVYIRNRLAFWLWNDQELQRRLHLNFPSYSGGVKQLSDLPDPVQTSLWKAFPHVDNDGWSQLMGRLWSELQTPDNPFARGLDTGNHVPAPEPEGLSWKFEVGGAAGVIALAAGALFWWRRRGGPPSGPTVGRGPVSGPSKGSTTPRSKGSGKRRTKGARGSVRSTLTSLQTLEHAFLANLTGFVGVAALLGFFGFQHWLLPTLIAGGIWLILTAILAPIGRARQLNAWLVVKFGSLFWEIWPLLKIALKDSRNVDGKFKDQELEHFLRGHYSADELERMESDPTLQASYRKRKVALDLIFAGLFVSLVVAAIATVPIMFEHYSHWHFPSNITINDLIRQWVDFDWPFFKWILGLPVLWLVLSHAFVNWILSQLPEHSRLNVPALTRSSKGLSQVGRWPARHRRLTALVASGVVAAGIMWRTLAPHSEPPNVNAPPPAAAPASPEQQVQARLVQAAQRAADRVRSGFLSGSSTREEVLNLLNAFIASPKIIPMTPEEAADGAYLAYTPADGGAIRVNIQAFTDPTNAGLDAYLDSAMVHELTHGAGKQVARSKLIAELDDEREANPDGITLDGPEGARYRDRRKTLEALHARNELEAFENEVMYYGRAIARSQGIPFRDYLARQAQIYPYFQIFLDHLGLDDQLVDRDAVAVDLVMQGHTGGLGAQAGIMLMAYKEGDLTEHAFEVTQSWLQQGESPMPHLPAAEMARFRSWLSKWVNDRKRYDAPFEPANRGGLLRRLGGALAGALIATFIAFGLAAQERTIPARVSPPASASAPAPATTRQEFFTALEAFEHSNLPQQMADARRAIDDRLDALIDERDTALSADADAELPRPGARKLLFMRLYSIFKFGGRLNLPEDLAEKFREIARLDEETNEELARAEAVLFPPVLVASRPPPLSAKELLQASKRYKAARNRLRRALEESAPTAKDKEGFKDAWATSMKWYVTAGITQDADGVIHFGEVVMRTSGLPPYRFVLHVSFKHFELKEGELRIRHTLGPKVVKSAIDFHWGGIGTKIPEDWQIKDPDFAIPIAPDLPPFLQPDPAPPGMGPGLPPSGGRHFLEAA